MSDLNSPRSNEKLQSGLILSILIVRLYTGDKLPEKSRYCTYIIFWPFGPKLRVSYLSNICVGELKTFQLGADALTKLWEYAAICPASEAVKWIFA